MRALVTTVSLLVLVFLAAPALVVVPLSFSASPYLIFPPPGYSTRWYAAVFADEVWRAAAWVSLEVAVLSMGLAILLGTPAAWALVRGRIPGRRLLSAYFYVPLLVPSIILAVAMFIVFSKLGLIGSVWALVAAHTALGAPFVVATVSASLQTLDPRIEQAALSLGASWAATFFRVILPNIWPGMLGGGLFAFITSFDEIVIALFIAGPRFTLPKKMFDNLRTEVDPSIAAVSTLLIALSAVVVLIVTLWLGRALAPVLGGLTDAPDAPTAEP
jgi:ABC-type spermidine/putrescine transport system permease subunit II